MEIQIFFCITLTSRLVYSIYSNWMCSRHTTRLVVYCHSCVCVYVCLAIIVRNGISINAIVVQRACFFSPSPFSRLVVVWAKNYSRGLREHHTLWTHKICIIRLCAERVWRVFIYLHNRWTGGRKSWQTQTRVCVLSHPPRPTSINTQINCTSNIFCILALFSSGSEWMNLKS